MLHKIKFVFEKETANTVRYKTEPGVPPIVKTVYVEKWALPDPIPQAIHIVLTDAPLQFEEDAS